MAEKDKKHIENVKGKYYVDENCIHCEACIMEAPGNFDMEGEEAHSYVKKQPEDDVEVEMVELAMEVCPVKAIGNDGNS